MRKRQKKVKKSKMMEQVEVEGSALCILCGHLNSWEGEGQTRGSLLSSLKSWGNEEERARDLLEEFGRQLQFGMNHRNQEEEEGDGDGQGAMIDLMEVLWDKEGSKSYSWTLCWDCAPAIKRAVEERRRCLKMEERVTKLQQRLLEELGKLKEGMGKFYLELKGVEELLMNGRGKGGGVRRGDFGIVKRGHSTANSLRKRILGAMIELQAYQSDLNAKFVTVTPASEVKIEPQDEAVMTEETDGDPASPGPSSDMDCTSPGEVNDIADGSETDLGNCPTPATPTRKGFGATSNAILAGSQDSVAQGVTDQDQDESNPESSSGPANEGNNSESESGDSDNDNSHSGSDSDWEGSPSPPKRAKSSQSKNARERRPPSPVSDGSTLKEMFILKAVRDQKARNQRLKTKYPPPEKGNAAEDVIRETKYSQSTGKLTVGEVELKFDEEQKLVQCGSCSFQITWSEALSSFNGKLEGKVQITGMMRTLSDHIHSAHLDAFKCPTCGVRKATHRRYKVHMSRTHLGIFPCDICGRPLKSQECVASHKWSHMNEEEKEEARLKGKKDPRTHKLRSQEKEANLLLSCDICQKRFKSRLGLQLHTERAHLGEKELVICPVCGKSMLKFSYDSYHKIYVCPVDATAGDQLEVKCIHCPAVLKHRKGLKLHMARHHSAQAGERPHLCFQCGMSFRTKTELKNHMETHQTERLWRCSRGCGKDFNVKLYCRRHEAKCKYSAEGEDRDDGKETYQTERLWKCSRGCGKDFNVKRYCTRHEKRCKYSAPGIKIEAGSDHDHNSY